MNQRRVDPARSVLRKAPEREAEPDTLSESEVVVAMFRTILVLVVLLAPPLTRAYRLSSHLYAGVICASVYSLLMSLVLYYRITFRFQRHFVVVVDILLLTFLIYYCGRGAEAGHQNQLFPLYYLEIIVAAIWFNVAGAMIAAAFSSFVFLLTLFTLDMYLGHVDVTEQLVKLLSVEIPLMFLVAMLSGYLAEAWDRERQRRFEAQRIIDEFRRQMEFAGQVQELLIPATLPEVQGLDLGFRSRAAEVVGGDYYDVLRLSQERVGLAVADVAGKSVPGVLRLPLFKYALQACAHVFTTPAQTLTHLNQILFADLQPDMFISLAYATLDVAHSELCYANAGHAPSLLLHSATGEVLPLPSSGMVLGVEPHLAYAEERYEFQPGDCLILYTDGVLEASNAEGEEFGLDRLIQTVRNSPTLTAQELADRIFNQVNDFETGPKRDDLTILVARKV